MESKENKCFYHPTNHAQFYCDSCATHYCPHCITWRKNEYYLGEIHYMCPRCNVELKVLGISHLIDPFWQKLHTFFRYPLRKEILLMLTCLAFISSLTMNLISSNSTFINLYCLPMLGLCFLLILFFCNDVFQTTIEGNFSPPSVGVDLEHSYIVVFKQLILLVLFIALETKLKSAVSYPYSTILIQLTKSCMPAILILLLLNQRLSSALNPLHIITLINRLGWRYILLCCFFIFLSTASFSIISLLIFFDLDFTFSSNFISLFFQFYYIIVIYHLLGYVVLQYHKELDYTIGYTHYLRRHDKEMIAKQLAVDPIYNDAKLLIGEGKAEEALKMIFHETKEQFQNYELALLYIRLLDLLGKSSRLKIVATPILRLLINNKKISEAANLYLRCLNDIQDFIASPSTLHALYEWFCKQGKYEDGIRCAVLFMATTSHDYRSPDLHFSCARLAIKKLDDKKYAYNLLTNFLDSYPDHKREDEAKKILIWLEKGLQHEVKY